MREKETNTRRDGRTDRIYIYIQIYIYIRYIHILGHPEKEKKSYILEALDVLCSLSIEPNLGQIGHNLTKREPFKVDLVLF